MTPKNKLFIGILAFMLIVNILVIFDINQFYIRAILGFVFLITIPGLLIMLCLKIRNINFWEYLVYTIGLSVAFIMFAGLAVNWILPFLNITDKPLSLWPILISFDIFLLIFTFIAQKRNEDNAHILIFPFEEYERKPYSRFKFIPKFLSLSWLDRIFIIIPFFFPFMAVIGAFLLNNHGTNIITMIMLGAIAVYVFCIVFFRDKLNENVFPWALYWMGLALLLMSSLRSWHISGHDILYEYKVYKLTFENSFWDVGIKNLPYNVSLSLNILPTIYKIFTDFQFDYIFKINFQIIFSVITIIIYLNFKRYILPPLSFIGAFLFLSTPYTFFQLTMLMRQEIALIFFGLMLLVLFSKEINSKTRNLLFVIFGFSMIVSHYSTAYIALSIFLLTYIFTLIYKLYENRKIKKGTLKPDERSELYLTGILMVLLLIFGFLWYSQVTETSTSLIDFTKKSIANFGKLLNEDVTSKITFPTQQFKIFHESKDLPTILLDYTNRALTEYQNSNVSLYPKKSEDNIRIASSGLLKTNFSYKYSYYIYIFREIINLILKVLILLGIIFIIFSSKIKLDKEQYLIIVLSIFLLFLSLILPLITSGTYDALRFFQVILILVGFVPIIFLYYISRKSFVVVAIFYIIYFLLSSGLLFQIVGGFVPLQNLNNFGDIYDRFYTHYNEILSINYLSNNSNKIPIYMDIYSYRKNLAFGDVKSKVIQDILPGTITKEAYVYSSYMNTVKRIINKPFRKESYQSEEYLTYNYPTDFLNENKNKIYNNGGSEIFK